MTEDKQLVDSQKIDISKRFDIYPKLLYARFKKQNYQVSNHNSIYYEHTKLYNDFNEFDNAAKTGFTTFIDTFNGLLKTYAKGIVPDEPVKTLNFSLINGLHRVASALTYFSKVYATKSNVKTEGRLHWPYFKNDEIHLNDKKNVLKNLDADYLGLMEFVKHVENAKVLVLTPNCTNKLLIEELLKHEHFEKIIYKKSLNLTDAGYLNLNNQLYGLEDWANLESLTKHTKYCSSDNFLNSKKVDLYLMNISLDQALELKKTIRKIFHKEEHVSFKTVCHINDTYEETIDLVRSLFSEKSEFVLNNAKFMDYSTIMKKFMNLYTSSSMQTANIADEYVLSGSSAIEFFIDREATSNDIDIILASTVDYKQYCRNRNCSSYNYYGDEYLKYFEVSNFDELVMNPENYFWLYGLKIMMPKALVKLKANRLEKLGHEKDLIDLRLLQNFDTAAKIKLFN